MDCMTMKYIAPYILRQEYECHHCHSLPCEIFGDWVDYPWFYFSLFEAFGNFRKAWGKPVNITSGYRCLERNKEVGGVLLSVHIFGGALDMKFRDDEETANAARAVDDTSPFLRMGVYLHGQSRLHVDVGYLVIPKMREAWVAGARWGDR